MLLIVSLCSLALAQERSDWMFREVGDNSDMTPSLTFDDEMIFRIESTTTSQGVFKLSKIIPHPQGNAWELSAKVRVTAENIDLDYDNMHVSGAMDEGEDNDGPNFFGFIYGYDESTIEKPGFITGTLSFCPYPVDSKLCHAHFECNWAGPNAYHAQYGYYCSSGSDTDMIKAGWVADGANSGTCPLALSGGYSDYDSEAFTSGEWKTVKMSIQSGECMYDNLTIVFMGADAFSDREYIWEIKEITTKGETTETLSVESAYDMMEGEEISAPAYCGNGRIDEDEDCDGSETPEGYTCSDECKVESVCGDGIVVSGEICDSSSVTSGYVCSKDCSTESPICGDGKLVGEEMCDPGITDNSSEGWSCADDCLSMTPICGDGIVVGTEECDGTAGLPSNQTACSEDCTIYRLLSSEEDLSILQLFTLAEQATAETPSEISFNFTESGSITATDLMEQERIKGMLLPGNHSFHFCTQGITVCEEDYIISGTGKVRATNQTITFAATQGTFKVFVFNSSEETQYYIGYNDVGSAKPMLGDYSMLIVALVSLILIAFMLVFAGGIAFFYFRKKHSKKPKKPESKKKEEE